MRTKPKTKPARARVMWDSINALQGTEAHLVARKERSWHTPVLVLPWTPADRERMVEAMAKAMYRRDFPGMCWQNEPGYHALFIDKARAALVAIAKELAP